MHLSVVALCLVIVACVRAQPLVNYKGCQTRTSHTGTTIFTASATAVSQCQAFCSGAGQTVGNVALISPVGVWPDDVTCRCNFVGTVVADSNCDNSCPGATPLQGSHCGGDSHNSVYPLTCTGVCDDPHFTGLDGSRYDYMANPNRVVALISDRSTQVNARFIPWGNPSEGNTFVGEVGIRVCDHTLRLLPNRTVVLDESRILDMKSSNTATTLSPAFTVQRLWVDAVRIHAGNWRMSVKMHLDHINILGMVHLDPTDTFVHGVYGITGHPDHHQRKAELCQPSEEGGCELPGKWQDYELPVGADLFSTEWTYKQFDSANCESLVQKAVKLQEQEESALLVKF